MNEEIISDVGYFITFEGVDGSGKSTLLDRVFSSLKEEGREVIKTSMLSDGPYREAFLSVPAVSPRHEVILARSVTEFALSYIRNKLDKGCIVLCDRGPDSFKTYQGYGKDQLLLVYEIEQLYQTEITPDLTIYLDTPNDVCLSRIAGRDKKTDIYESKSQEYHDKVRHGFEELIRMDVSEVERDVKRYLRFVRIDGTQSVALSLMESMLKIHELFERM